MDRLPEDIVMDILSRLRIKSLIGCRCVSKSWRDLTHDPRFIHMHLHRASSLQTHPSLILQTTIFLEPFNFHSHLYLLELTEIQHDHACSPIHFSRPNFEEFRIMGSCNGLLCLAHRISRCMIYVCNPLTNAYVKLPDPISPVQFTSDMVVGFGFNPKRNEFKVVQIIHDPQLSVRQSEVYVHTLGDGSWRALGHVPYVTLWHSFSVAFVSGALHWVGLFPENFIICFDIVDEVAGVIPRPEVGAIRPGDYSLGVLSGCLVYTDSSSEDHVEIWVMKHYGVKESWARFFTIYFDQVGRNIRFIRTLCLATNGEILMLYNNQELLSYNPQTMRLRMLSIVNLPSWFEAVTHVGSLVSPPGCLRHHRR